MGRKNIHTFSLGYQVVFFLANIFHHLYYKKVVSKGKKNIPKGSPVIFAGSHQNALMDALAIIFASGMQMVFFARADIFRKKSTARWLYFLKILPVYRIRDGFRSVDRNQEVFDEAIHILQHKRSIGILPEGNHVGQKRLRPLRKGTARMALMAEEASGFRLGLQIVPAGIDYSNYFNAGSTLLVKFGPPIQVSDYEQWYHENPPQAIRKLTDDLYLALKAEMIHIDSEPCYDTIHTATEIYLPEELETERIRKTLYNRFLARKKIIGKLNAVPCENDESMKALKNLTAEYSECLRKNLLRDWLVRREKISLLSFILEAVFMAILFPLYLYGMVMNYIPYHIPVRITRKIKDPHFIGSVRFGAGFLLFLLWYLLWFLIALFVPVDLAWKVLFLFGTPFAGVFSFYYYRNVLKMKGKYRWLKLMKDDKDQSNRMIFLRKKISAMVKEWMMN